MIVAAGILVVAPCPVTGADTALMLLRGPGSDHPFEWAFPGGQAEPGETAAEAACRECAEECGLEVAPGDLGSELTRGVARATVAPPCACCGSAPCSCPPGCAGCDCPRGPSEDVDFTSFLHRVDAQFTPVLCGEHVGFCWSPLDRPPAPTHPGCLVSLRRPTMNELDVARAISEGGLVSPQRYANMWLFAIRITATGAAYRTKLREWVWRDASIYLNEEFVARCGGLPVIWEHPKEGILTTAEYKDRNVGSIMFAYIKGEEVWAVARIYDEDAARGLADEQLSTSPAVVFKDRSKSERAKLEDGSTVLIEADPDLLDHIAVCAKGVWDKGGEAMGVDRGGAVEALADSEPAAFKAAKLDQRGRVFGLRARALGLRALT